MIIYKKLSESEAYALPENHLVYVTSVVFSMNRLPALVQRKPYPNCIKVVSSEPVSVILDKHAHYGSEYGKGWYIEVENGFTVNTPDGTIHVYDKNDSEYPGVKVDLHHEETDESVGLAMVEYIPGDEGVCCYEPRNPSAMEAELHEVPMERMAHEDDTPVTTGERETLTLIQASSFKYKVTSGLVTRAWPDERHNEDNHRRVFHYGYKNG